MSAARALLVLCSFAALAAATDLASFRTSFRTQDGGLIYADIYGHGQPPPPTRGVVLAHGARFNKESWSPQAQALAEAGFCALAIDFRGYGGSRPGPSLRPVEEAGYLDILAAINYLRTRGSRTVSVIGASMGGDYAAEASEAQPNAIDRLVLLAAGAYTPLRRTRGRKLFILSRDDVMGDNQPRLPAIRAQYETASGPKELVVLPGAAHAQAIFKTQQGERLMREIIGFLSAP